jgi:hypothetical protein
MNGTKKEHNIHDGTTTICGIYGHANMRSAVFDVTKNALELRG